MHYEKGQYYHAYNRGNNKQPIFIEPGNYEYLLKLMRKNAARFRITVIAYCLMPNHYHILARQDDTTPLTKFIRSTFQSYAQAFNKRYRRTGKLFENSRDPIVIDDLAYLSGLCRYIHRNPVEAHLVENAQHWPYSNYREFIGDRPRFFHHPDLVKEWFASPEEYRRFVEKQSDETNYIKIQKYLF